MNPSNDFTLRPSDLAALLTAVVLPSAMAWLGFRTFADQPGQVQAVYTVGKIVQFAFPLAWMWAVCHWRPVWKRPMTAGLAEGLGFGILVLAGMLLLYHGWFKPAGYLAQGAGPIAEKVRSFGVAGPWGFFTMAVFFSGIHSLLEEYYWRWFVFGQMQRWLPLGAAVLASGLAFAAHHVIILATYFGWSSPATWVFSLGVAVGGAVWAWLYHRSDSLIGPWLSHLLADAGIFAVGYELMKG